MASLRQHLVALVQQGAISPEHMADAEQVANLTPNSQQWQQFLNVVFLWIGCIAMACAVIFFFAHNWSGMNRLMKFALLECLLLTCIFCYLKLQTNQNVAGAVLILACLLVGAVMALFGQTYQTGADPWQLFFNWALVITPWALVTRFSIMWLIWILLCNLAIALYCDVNNNPLSVVFNTQVSEFWLTFLFNLACFVSWQYLSQSHQWMQQNWLTRVLAVLTGICLTGLALEAVIEITLVDLLALVTWCITLLALYYCYRVKQLDLFMLAGGCLSFILVVTTWFATQFHLYEDMFAYLTLAFIVLTLGVVSTIWLKQLQKELHCE